VTSFSPSQILEAMSAVYDLLDEIASTHACVRRVVVGAHEILGCGGRFDFADQSEEQAESVALTCLECLSHSEEIDQRLAFE
jgi:hypothetical protein